MKTDIWYSARAVLDKSCDAVSWEKYIAWSKLAHISELVSLDGILNGLVFDVDMQCKETWEYLIEDDGRVTDFFNSLDYVLERVKGIKRFNLVAVIKDPVSEEKASLSDEYDFIGYELLDLSYEISALTNCGGFDESFLPSDLNQFGLINSYKRVREVQESLVLNNPEEFHADCNLFEVWRHKLIGKV